MAASSKRFQFFTCYSFERYPYLIRCTFSANIQLFQGNVSIVLDGEQNIFRQLKLWRFHQQVYKLPGKAKTEKEQNAVWQMREWNDVQKRWQGLEAEYWLKEPWDK